MAARDTLKLVGGMGLLLTGQKIPALASFGAGLASLEREWRAKHPEVEDTFEARWQAALDFYHQTHQDGINRKLHLAGIPLIVGGAAGLLLGGPFRPLWLGSAAAFAAGWALNIAGHALFEKNAPAFTQDPLSFIAGPAWDLKQMFGIGAKSGTAGQAVPVEAAPVQKA